MSETDPAKTKRGLIAARLREAREMTGLTQGQVAEMLGLHRPSISEAEAGRRRVSAEELSHLAEIYGVRLSWLAGSEDEDSDQQTDRLKLAARELAKLKPDDFERLMRLLKRIRAEEGPSR